MSSNELPRHKQGIMIKLGWSGGVLIFIIVYNLLNCLFSQSQYADLELTT